MITSSQNQTVKDMRRLRRSKGDLALLEGPHLVGEALDLGLELETVLLTPEAAETSLGERLARAPVGRLLPIEDRLLRQLCDADTPRGFLAAAHLRRPNLEGIRLDASRTWVLAAGIQDPGNLGALARVAEAAGAGGLLTTPGTVHPNHPRALRASAGSLLRLPVAVGVAPEALAAATEALPTPLPWAALQPRDGVDLYGVPDLGPVLLVLGAEGPGLADEVAQHCGLRLSIPMARPVESLNATVAAALVLFEIRRRVAMT